MEFHNSIPGAMPERKDDTHSSIRREYRKPILTDYGNVRDLTQSTGTVNGDGGQNMKQAMAMMSDRNVKDDIVRIGQHPLGLGIYVFRYKAPYSERYGNHRRVGVMADEVVEKYPDAVYRHADGYLRVDYGRLFR